MTSQTKITCDGCGNDLTSTGNSIDYRLLLANERLPIRGTTCTDMMIYPPIEGDAHFCGLWCLHTWLTRQELRRAWDSTYLQWKKFAP